MSYLFTRIGNLEVGSWLVFEETGIFLMIERELFSDAHRSNATMHNSRSRRFFISAVLYHLKLCNLRIFFFVLLSEFTRNFSGKLKSVVKNDIDESAQPCFHAADADDKHSGRDIFGDGVEAI